MLCNSNNNMKIISFDTIDSTNNYAKTYIQELKNNNTFSSFETTLIIAKTQTAGRGRLGRQFYSPADSGLYMSLIYKPQNNNSILIDPAKITATSAVAVCHILDKSYNIESKIKWVNDIYYNSKKICGILTEGVIDFSSRSIDAVIVGIGINICTTDFPSDISNKAGSITKSNQIDIQTIATQIADECVKIFSDPRQNTLAFSEYKQRSFLLGKQITIHPVIDMHSKDYQATAIDITEDAKLVVQLEDGSQKILDSGEVSTQF